MRPPDAELNQRGRDSLAVRRQSGGIASAECTERAVARQPASGMEIIDMVPVQRKQSTQSATLTR